MVELTVTADLVKICQEIIEEGKTEAQWAEIESDDMFQLGTYTGGYDSTEKAFCFETFVDREEIWFQFTLAEAEDIATGRPVRIEVKKAAEVRGR